ncbi:MAG: hypothetical protein IKO16_00450 [Lachnospiraceae bacterium]|nr:hypothetical protein [Lachnospiraceae bacterium]
MRKKTGLVLRMATIAVMSFALGIAFSQETKAVSSWHIHVSAAPSVGGTVSPEYAFEYGSIGLSATPNPGYEFDRWDGANIDLIPEEGRKQPTVTAILPQPPDNNHAYFTAVFKRLHNVTVTKDGHGTAGASPTSASNDAVINLSASPDSGN